MYFTKLETKVTETNSRPPEKIMETAIQHTQMDPGGKKQNNYIRACCSELFRILDKDSTKSRNLSCRESKYLQIVVKTLVKQK